MFPSRYCFAAFAVGLLITGHVGGQPVARGESEVRGLDADFLMRVWDSSQGLPQTTVRSLTQSTDGYVWTASTDGLARLDGARVVRFDYQNSPLPEGAGVHRVHADRTGRLWVATDTAKLFVLENNSWRECGELEGWSGTARVESITENTRGTLVISTASNLFRFDQGHFTTMEFPELPRDFTPPLTAMFGSAGKLWVTSTRYVWRQERSGWTKLTTSATLGSQIRGAAPAQNGGLWVATAKQIHRVGTEEPRVLERPRDFDKSFLQMLEDSAGNLWAGSLASGIRVWMADGRVLAATSQGDLLHNSISCLYEDHEGNVLIGTAGAGLARFKPRRFEVFLGRLGDLAGTIVNTVCEESPGTMLVGSAGAGLNRIVNGRLAGTIRSADGRLAPESTLNSVIRLRDGTVLAGVLTNGLYRVEGSTAKPVSEPCFAGRRVRALFEDSRGTLWVGHENGVCRRSAGGKFEEMFVSGSLPFTQVRTFAEDREGVVWAAGRQGLARVTVSGLERVPLPAVGGRLNVLGLHVTRDGALWVGLENHGLIRMRAGNFFHYTEEHGLPVRTVASIIDDGEALWLGSERGVARVLLGSLIAVASDLDDSLHVRLYTRSDGLPSEVFRRGLQPVVCRATDGRLWFALTKGVVAARPGDFTGEPPDRHAIIEEVVANGKSLAVTPQNDDNLRLPAGSRRMQIRYSQPSLSEPEEARFQYRLEGLDEDWQDAGNERMATFYDLHPRTYRFHVRAADANGSWSESSASVVVAVLPFYWQTFWFRTLVLVCLIGSAVLAVWWYFQKKIALQATRLREQEERAHLETQLQQSQRLEAIGRLAGGVAHDFNNMLTVIIGNAELARLDQHGPGRLHEMLNDILQAGERARELVGQILTFSRQKHSKRSLIDIGPTVREAFKLLRAGIPATIELRVSIPPRLPTVLADPAQIQRMIMNLGTNASHAVGTQGGRVDIALEAVDVDAAAASTHTELTAGRYVRLSVSDNGHGMDDETLKRIFEPFFTTKDVGRGTGLGLAVVHGIVQAHDGVISVQSRPNEGTTFHIWLPTVEGEPENAATAVESLPCGHGEEILVVDDEGVVINLVRRMLERQNYRVIAFVDPDGALTAFREEPQRYALVLTDLAMPQISGIELARRIWQIRAEVPILLATAFGGGIGAEAAEEVGFCGLLNKPYQFTQLCEALARALATKKAD